MGGPKEKWGPQKFFSGEIGPHFQFASYAPVPCHSSYSRVGLATAIFLQKLCWIYLHLRLFNPAVKLQHSQ